MGINFGDSRRDESTLLVAIPEPQSGLLAGLGVLLLVGGRRRQSQADPTPIMYECRKVSGMSVRSNGRLVREIHGESMVPAASTLSGLN